jgi:hypothetical protein
MCLTPTADIMEFTDPLEKNVDWQGGYYRPPKMGAILDDPPVKREIVVLRFPVCGELSPLVFI